MIVERALYRDGRRTEAGAGLTELGRACRAGEGIAWVGLHRPTEAEFAEVAREFGLHPLAVEDAVHAHQRAKLERYGDTIFCVLLAASYDDEREEVRFGELHVFAGPSFVITVRHGDPPDLGAVRRGLETRPDLLRRGTVVVLHAILDRVVDDYAPVVAGLENDIDEIEDQVFQAHAGVSRRIYELLREVISFHRAARPLPEMLEALMADMTEDQVEERRDLRDVHDHALRVQEAVEGFRQLLENILNVNVALETKALNEASNAQNEEVKRISAWAAILFAPTLVGTVYGMNFTNMPELDWRLGYPFAIGLMVAVSVVLYAVFKRRGWI